MEWLSGDSAMQVRRAGTGSIQSMMVHASGRAEIGHHRAEQESTRALALVHADPSMRCRQLGLSPLSSPRSVVIGSPPLALVPPTLALQKRNKRDPKPVLGPAVFGHLCQCAALLMEVRKCGRGQRGGEPGAWLQLWMHVSCLGLGRGCTWDLSSGVRGPED